MTTLRRRPAEDEPESSAFDGVFNAFTPYRALTALGQYRCHSRKGVLYTRNEDLRLQLPVPLVPSSSKRSALCALERLLIRQPLVENSCKCRHVARRVSSCRVGVVRQNSLLPGYVG